MRSATASVVDVAASESMGVSQILCRAMEFVCGVCAQCVFVGNNGP
jgi:hypothetical protein